jgi:hypothetical protein
MAEWGWFYPLLSQVLPEKISFTDVPRSFNPAYRIAPPAQLEC